MPYILDKKVRCNKANNDVTAYYAGVDIGDGNVANVINVKYIWEKSTASKTKSGVVALINTKLGCDRIQNITDLSLHLILTNSSVVVQILGNAYGKYYYQDIINTSIAPQDLDGVTEHELTLHFNGNTVYVFIDNTINLSGTFKPTSDFTSLSEIVGQYAIFEHYCGGDMNTYCMPMFTKFLVRQDDFVYVYDKFDREDGQLANTPQGLPYHLFATLHNIG